MFVSSYYINTLCHIHNKPLHLLALLGILIGVEFISFLIFTISVGSAILPVAFFPDIGKTIYHQSGRYYLKLDSSNATVYDDYAFYKKELFTIQISQDFEKVKTTIKTTIDSKISSIQSRKLEKIKDKTTYEKYKDMIKDWDGFLDKDISRDNKIRRII
jgi:hypothetical protein